MNLEEAQTRKAQMIADVRFWFELSGARVPPDDVIWRAWGKVLSERGTADSFDVTQYLVRTPWLTTC